MFKVYIRENMSSCVVMVLLVPKKVDLEERVLIVKLSKILW